MDSNICCICNGSLQTEIENIDEVRELELQYLIERSKEVSDDLWKEWSVQSIIHLHNKCKLNYLNNSPKPKRRKVMSPVRTFEVVTDTTTSISTSVATVFGSTETLTTSTTSITCTAQPIVNRSNNVSTPSTSNANSNLQENLTFNFSDLCLFCSSKLDKKHKKVHCFSKKTTKDDVIKSIENSTDEDIEEIIQRVHLAFNSNCNPISYHGACQKRLTKVRILLLLQ